MRQRTQNEDSQAPKNLSDEHVIDYLRRHPNFFADKTDLLIDLQLHHPAQGRAVSLIERQVLALREANDDMREQLNQLVDNARNNDLLLEHTQQLLLSLLETREIDDCLDKLFDSFRDDFNIDYSQVILVPPADKQFPTPKTPRARIIDRRQAMESLVDIMHNQPHLCGQLNPRERQFIFEREAANIGSAAVISLRTNDVFLGFLAVASRDPDHYSANMSTSFLSFIADAVSRLLLSYLADR
ncbi:MAG: hypothetical protein ACJA04_001133 [Cellvibrionaceae bacterium]|jgi:uncharacterized protein YigA (DUF484 family)